MKRIPGTAYAVLLCVLIGLALAPGCSRSGDTAASSPGKKGGEAAHDYNVLLITLDTTRVDYLSCYDSSKGELTPNIDAIAADGVRFDFAIAQSSGTPMSHASILTGLNPYQHGVRVISAAGGYKLKSGIPTLATILSEHGWNTAAFLSAFTVSEYYDFNRGFDTYDNGLTQSPESIVREDRGGRMRWEQDKHQRRSDTTINQALTWLSTPRQKPFFLWIHLWDPHDRMILPPEEFLEPFLKPGLTEEEVKRAIYAAEIQFVDLQIGRLMTMLKERGWYEKTLIAIVADHGQGLGQHNWWSHRLLYQEDIHVPMILRGPDWPRKRTVDELVRTIDIAPTVLECLGIKAPLKPEGVSLLALMEGREIEPRMAYSDQIIEYDMVGIQIAEQRPKDNLSYCAMDRTWKLIYRYTYPEYSELFNVREDPHELKNVAAEHPEELRRLKQYLDECGGYVTAPFTELELPDERILNSLEALGYAGGSGDDDPEESTADKPAAAPPAAESQPTTRPCSQPTTQPVESESNAPKVEPIGP